MVKIFNSPLTLVVMLVVVAWIGLSVVLGMQYIEQGKINPTLLSKGIIIVCSVSIVLILGGLKLHTLEQEEVN
jgi:succinate dehydrogenase hydrophobic anchor subunit